MKNKHFNRLVQIATLASLISVITISPSQVNAQSTDNALVISGHSRASRSKYITRRYSIPCHYGDYIKKCQFPARKFYNDGMYSGWLYLDDSIPADVRKDYTMVSYSGTVTLDERLTNRIINESTKQEELT